MNAALDWAAAILVLLGSLFALTAAIGLVRFPDTVSRMHPSTKTQVLGLLLVLVGAGIRLRGSVDVGMLVLAGLFTVIVSPVFAHLVGRSAYRERGLRVDLMTRDEMPAEPAVVDEKLDDDDDVDDDDAEDAEDADGGAGDGGGRT
ncbi:monovalent cation/H(+) antiporter subunit G [Tomitella fengzijianii]|uniref:monovalent cation/H(+) antiporter subunit G n=1 Tax=Tomitella fengzijianii TaxID=2597660 RepID=UPI00131D0E27|nr:monovalent cation/H(+) antiporter subunit G [Tomitella fengzijianii]